MDAVGGSIEQRSSLCCMVCDPTAFSDGGRLDVLKVGTTPRKKRRVAIRRVTVSTTEAVKIQLKAARANYIEEHPSLAILGAQLVYPDSVISNISSSVKFISVLSDMDAFCLRQELKEKFFNVLLAVVNNL